MRYEKIIDIMEYEELINTTLGLMVNEIKYYVRKAFDNHVVLVALPWNSEESEYLEYVGFAKK